MQTLRFGKKPPTIDYRTLRFRAYLTPALPAPSPSYDALARIYLALATTDTGALFPMDGNDRLGDCTIAALAHAVTTFRGLIGTRHVMSEAAVVALYEKLTGGDDTGLVALDVLNYWRHHAASGDRILAYISVDPRNHTHVKQAIAMFGGVYLGFQVQQDCIRDFTAHRPWTPGRLTRDGHAVFAVGYDAHGVDVLTWGATQRGTWDWWDACVDEAYAVLPPEAKDARFTPGFDFAQLTTDLAALTDAAA